MCEPLHPQQTRLHDLIVVTRCSCRCGRYRSIVAYSKQTGEMDVKHTVTNRLHCCNTLLQP